MQYASSETCLEYMWDKSGTCTRCIRASAKPCNKAAARLSLTSTPFFFRRVQNACETHLECVQDASGMRANITLELSCTITYNLPWLLLLKFFYRLTITAILGCHLDFMTFSPWSFCVGWATPFLQLAWLLWVCITNLISVFFSVISGGHNE